MLQLVVLRRYTCRAYAVACRNDDTTTSLANPYVPAFVRLRPNPQFEAEELTAYELGYRVTTTRPERCHPKACQRVSNQTTRLDYDLAFRAVARQRQPQLDALHPRPLAHVRERQLTCRTPVDRSDHVAWHQARCRGRAVE